MKCLLVSLLLMVAATAVAVVLAGAFFCTERIVVVWATGGLETSLFSLLGGR